MKTYPRFKFGTIQEWKAEKENWADGVCNHNWVFQPQLRFHICTKCFADNNPFRWMLVSGDSVVFSDGTGKE